MNNPNNPWISAYKEIIGGLTDPLFILFPVLENHFLLALPVRRERHRKLDKLYDLILGVISDKKRIIQEGYKSSGDDSNEKDLLTLMIEANETDKLGGLSDKELLVSSIEMDNVSKSPERSYFFIPKTG